MSALYGRTLIHKTARGYMVDGIAYRTITEATNAIDKKNKRKRWFRKNG